MTSNVIINFGANASQAFKAMHAVKAEMKTVQAQAAKTTAAAVTSAKASAGAVLSRSASLGRLGRFGVLGGAFSLGPAGFGAILALGAAFAAAKKVGEGFMEVVSASKGLTFAVGVVSDGLKSLGRGIGNLVTGDVGSTLAQGIVDALFPGLPRLSVLTQAGNQIKDDNTLLTGSMFTSPVSEYEKWEAKKLEIEKRQLAYVKDTATTLRRMENDLERMNTVDPW